MKFVKKCGDVIFLRNVTYEDRDILALFGGKPRHDLDYTGEFKDCKGFPVKQVEAFELPPGR